MYADDLTIYSSGAEINTTTDDVQNAINKLANWAKMNGFEFATEKTKAMHICRRYTCQIQPLLLNGTVLEAVTQYNFLGLIIDKRLDWKQRRN